MAYWSRGRCASNGTNVNLAILLTVLIVAAADIQKSANAAIITVGDSAGWTLAFNYTAWAATKVFRINDILDFVYPQGLHNVFEVNKADYDACASTNSISLHQTGNDTIVITKPVQYFICGFPQHCVNGMKIAISAVADAPPPSAVISAPPPVISHFSPPASPPAATPPVISHPPAPAPAPALPTPTTSPPSAEPPTKMTPPLLSPIITPPTHASTVPSPLSSAPTTSSPTLPSTISPSPSTATPPTTPTSPSTTSPSPSTIAPVKGRACRSMRITPYLALIAIVFSGIYLFL